MSLGLIFGAVVMVAAIGFVAVRMRQGRGDNVANVLAGLAGLNLGGALMVSSVAGSSTIQKLTIGVLLTGALGCYVAERRIERMRAERLER